MALQVAAHGTKELGVEWKNRQCLLAEGKLLVAGLWQPVERGQNPIKGLQHRGRAARRNLQGAREEVDPLGHMPQRYARLGHG